MSLDAAMAREELVRDLAHDYAVSLAAASGWSERPALEVIARARELAETEADDREARIAALRGGA